MRNIIGLSFGYSNCRIGIIKKGEFQLIPNNEGRYKTPSIVAFLKNNTVKVGDPAKRQAITNANNTIIDIKYLIGKNYNEIEVKKDDYRFEILETKNSEIAIKVNNEYYSPTEICTFLFAHLKNSAEEELEKEIEEVVITIPHYYNNVQTNQLKIAAKKSGFKKCYFIDETIAAALPYTYKQEKRPEIIIVFSLNKLVLELSVITLKSNVYKIKSAITDLSFGGEDFTKQILYWLVSEFKNQEGIDLRTDVLAYVRLYEAAEKAKLELSTSTTTEINIPYITSKDGVHKHFIAHLTRKKLEALCEEHFYKIISYCHEILNKVNLNIRDIQEIVLAGGATNMPKIQEIVREYFLRSPKFNLGPNKIKTWGATLMGEILGNDTIETDNSEIFHTMENNIIKSDKFDLAISFAGEDRMIAELIAESLIKSGYNVFYDNHFKSKLWGKDLYVYLQDIYKNKAKYCLMIISKNYANKLWTNHERQAAQAKAFEQNKEYILPLRIDETEIPGLNNTIGYLHYDDQTSINEIVEILKEKLNE